MSGNAQSMMDKAYWQGAGQFQNDQNRLLQAGQAAGNLSNQNISALSGLAKTNADITTGAVNTGIGVANAYSQQAGALSNTNLMNTNALMQSGQMQQQQAQLPLTAQYQQWQQEQKWPFEMINFLNSAQRGLSQPTFQSGTSSTTASSGSSGSSSPSIAGSVLGVLSSANSIFGKDNKGGIERGIDAITGPAKEDPNAPGSMYPARGGYIKEYIERDNARRRRDYARGGAVSRYSVGGDVPVERGMMMRGRRPPMGPPGMPPGGMGGALPPGPFARQGGLSMGMPPMGGGAMPPPMRGGPLPRGGGDMAGILSMMR
jgi:hypothetical protein